MQLMLLLLLSFTAVRVRVRVFCNIVIALVDLIGPVLLLDVEIDFKDSDLLLKLAKLLS